MMARTTRKQKKQEEWEIICDEGEVPPPPQPVGEALERRQHQWRQLPYNTGLEGSGQTFSGQDAGRIPLQQGSVA